MNCPPSKPNPNPRERERHTQLGRPERDMASLCNAWKSSLFKCGQQLAASEGLIVVSCKLYIPKLIFTWYLKKKNLNPVGFSLKNIKDNCHLLQKWKSTQIFWQCIVDSASEWLYLHPVNVPYSSMLQKISTDLSTWKKRNNLLLIHETGKSSGYWMQLINQLQLCRHELLPTSSLFMSYEHDKLQFYPQPLNTIIYASIKRANKREAFCKHFTVKLS